MQAGLSLVAFPVTFYVANLASALPALFPTSSRYSSMGIAYNFSVAIFGGTTPFLVQGLIAATGDDMAPAYYLMGTSVIGAIAIYFLRESARPPAAGLHAERGHRSRGPRAHRRPGPKALWC
ncbi:Proline/betaine transporter [Arthrobacter sp. Bi83]|jgi:MHS family proline/betaine transporter-like MFS transporter|nr:Proline/betaine transporter [Arthrobacter sp. Bi83]